MTKIVANTNTTNTFDYWRNRTNELADAMTNYVVTTDSNTAVGNAAISGTFTANVLTANTLSINTITANSEKFGNTTVNSSINSTAFALANSSSNLTITLPTSAQIISTNVYVWAANSTWYSLPNFNFISTITVVTSGTSAQLVDSYPANTYVTAKYVGNVVDNVSNNFMSTELLVSHNFGDSLISEYSTILSNTTMGTFTTNVNSFTVRLYFTPVSTTTSVKFVRTVV